MDTIESPSWLGITGRISYMTYQSAPNIHVFPNAHTLLLSVIHQYCMYVHNLSTKIMLPVASISHINIGFSKKYLLIRQCADRYRHHEQEGDRLMGFSL